MAAPQWLSGLGAAMGVGQPGFGAALGAASPLLLSMGQNLQSGRPAMENANQALGAMIELQDRKDKKDQEKAAQDAFSAMIGVPGAAGTPFAPGPIGLPSAMGARNAAPATSGPLASAMTAPQGFSLPQAPSGASLGQSFDMVEKQFGLPAGYLGRTAQIESGGNAGAKNPNSSAKGLFQFVDSTAKQYGVNPMDPTSSTIGAARLASDNAQVLRQTLGREPTAGELYLAHQQGAGGAAALLSNPSAPAASVVGKKAVELNGGDANMTAGDFANRWLSKFGEGARGGAAAAPVDPMSDPQVQRMMQILAMPGLQDGQRSVLQTMIQQRINTTQDAQKRAQDQTITPYQAATLGLQEAQLNQREAPDPSDRYKVVGGTLVDLLAEGGPTPVVRDQQQENFRMATPQEAAQYGATGGQFGPDGRFYPINPPSGMSIESDGNGGFRMTQGSVSTVGKPLTEGQSKDNMYLTAAQGALPGLDKYEGALVGMSGAMNGVVGAVPGGKFLQSEEYQTGKVAASEFGAAILRKESGAALTASDHEWLDNRYIPTPGDKPGTIQRKREARQRAINGLRSGMSAEQIRSAEMAIAAAPDDARDDPKTAPIEAPAGVPADVWGVMTPEERALWN